MTTPDFATSPAMVFAFALVLAAFLIGLLLVIGFQEADE